MNTNFSNASVNKKDAFKILGLSGEINPDIIKQAYRRASMKYHPDRNPSGKEMMQLVNMAYQAIKNFVGDAEISINASQYGETLSQALNEIIGLGLNIEICGAWAWVSGNTKPHKETLKKTGFKWAAKKCRWFYRPADYKSCSRGHWSMAKIRGVYGSKNVDEPPQTRLMTA